MENFLRQLLDMVSSIPAPGREPSRVTQDRGPRSLERPGNADDAMLAQGQPVVQGPPAPYSEMYNPEQFAMMQKLAAGQPGQAGAALQGPPAPAASPGREFDVYAQSGRPGTVPKVQGVGVGAPTLDSGEVELPPGGYTVGEAPPTHRIEALKALLEVLAPGEPVKVGSPKKLSKRAELERLISDAVDAGADPEEFEPVGPGQSHPNLKNIRFRSTNAMQSGGARDRRDTDEEENT
ncbi:MAG TPA: hypothetical protein VFH51_11525 [Myxococcota bacterium]|nr:hypothetical protein [Myxococcota bacterium]